MFKIIPFEPCHLDAFEINHATKFETEHLKKMSHYWKQGGPCFTGVYKGKIIGCAGLMELWPGVAQAWAAFEKGFPMFSVHKIVKKALATLMKDCRYHRVQSNTQGNFDIGKKWLIGNGKSKGLGFDVETILREYGPDKSDFIQYVRLG